MLSTFQLLFCAIFKARPDSTLILFFFSLRLVRTLDPSTLYKDFTITIAVGIVFPPLSSRSVFVSINRHCLFLCDSAFWFMRQSILYAVIVNSIFFSLLVLLCRRHRRPKNHHPLIVHALTCSWENSLCPIVDSPCFSSLSVHSLLSPSVYKYLSISCKLPPPPQHIAITQQPKNSTAYTLTI